MRPLLVLLGLLIAPALRAQEPEKEPAKPAAPSADRAEVQKSLEQQEILNRRFRDFESSLLHLSQHLERSSKPEDRERAANLRKALELASKENTDTKFDRLISMLKSSNNLKVNEIEEAMHQSNLLSEDIRNILALLMADNRDAELQREVRRTSELIKRLDKNIKDVKLVRAHTEASQQDKESLAKQQNKVGKDTEQIAKDMGKDAQGQPSDKSAKGGKGGKSGGGGGEGGEPKEGTPKNGEGEDKQSQESTPGRKNVKDAHEYERQAEQHIRQEKRQEASNKQDKAIEELEKAKKKLEEILRQLREEEMQRMLAALQARCERMLAMQIAIYDGTRRLSETIQGHPDKHAERIDEQKSLQLSDKEQTIVKEANAAIAILEAEGSAVAFPEAFVQVRDDATHVTRRLGKVDVGTVTQVIEQDIISSLKDMIEALKKKLEASKSEGGGGGKGQSALINLLAELKMIKAMQIRVNNRTVTYARQYEGEQAKALEIRKELVNLADRQQKIFDALNNIARGKNQ